MFRRSGERTRHVCGCVLGMFAFLLALSAEAQIEDAECFLCHGDPSASVTQADGTVVSLFVEEERYLQSKHAEVGCISCHIDIDEVPHPTDLEPVDCSVCHADVSEMYAKSLHGISVENADPLAPSCADCHTAHDIRSPDDPKSPTNPINIPSMCARCHAEDAPVAQSRNIEQHDILKNYEDSMHARGLLEQGLKVTAVCTSCHTAHNVLPHTDPESTIHRDKVVGTCTQCHALIEEVHRKVIDGKLWEEDPQKIPICIDCHQAHEARKIFYDEGVSDRDCMTCHEEAVKGQTRNLPAVDSAQIGGSAHTTVRCAQ